MGSEKTGTTRRRKSSTTTVKLADLVPDPNNARDHPEKNKNAILNSVRRFGAARSIVVDADGVVRAGNGTLEAAMAEGITDGIVVEADGKQLIIVKRSDLKDTEAEAYAVADNRAGDLAKWNDERLAQALQKFEELDTSLKQDVGFSKDEADRIIQRVSPAPDQTKELSEHHCWDVVVRLDSEADQVAFLEKMREEKFDCSALVG